MSQSGSKIILFHGASLIAILRDDIPDISFPNHWDLPGGGIEPGETPLGGLLREVEEELGLMLPPDSIVWEMVYATPQGAASYFFAAPITSAQIEGIIFGDEGQRWALMPMTRFCARADSVPHFRPRVAEFFDQYRSAGQGIFPT